MMIMHLLRRGPIRMLSTLSVTRPTKCSKSYYGVRFMVPVHSRSISYAARGLDFEPSDEQEEIRNALETHNVIVSARPGSGKTATAQVVVAANPGKPILVLTYSKNLQLNTRSKLSKIKDAKVDVHTFHAFAGKVYKQVVSDDQGLRKLRTGAIQPVQIPPYEIVILDEVQDMTPTLYWLTCTLLLKLRTQPVPPKVLVLGDARQSIYGYQQADARYLELAEQTFSGCSPYPWKEITLSKSYRLSDPTVRLVNAYVGENYIVGSGHGRRPVYIRADPFKVDKLLLELLPLIREFGPENCAILAPSVRKNIALARLANALARRGIPVAEPIFENGPLDSKVLQGKLAVSTFHQFKGRERDVVIAYGLGTSYFSYNGTDLPQDRCPNAIFVALTRAKEQLVIIQSHKEYPMPFVPWLKILDTCEVIPLAPEDPSDPCDISQQSLGKLRRVTDTIRHIQDEKLEQIIQRHLVINRVAKAPQSSINMNDTFRTHRGKGRRSPSMYEYVGDITGVAVTAAFEWKVTGKSSALNDAAVASPQVPPGEIPPPRFFAQAAAIKCAKESHYEPRLIQLQPTSYNWLDQHLHQAVSRLDALFQDKSLLTFEHRVSRQPDAGDGNHPTQALEKVGLEGRIDILERSVTEDDPPTIWEIKFVSSLSLVHVAQVVMYGHLWAAEQVGKSQKDKFPRLMLFNIRDGTTWEISTTLDGAALFTEEMLLAKYSSAPELGDEAFLQQCAQIRKEVNQALLEEQ